MRRRELTAGMIAVVLLLGGVLFLGPPETPAPSAPSPSKEGTADVGAVEERPAARRPEDPRRTPPTPRAAPATRPRDPAAAAEQDGTAARITVRVTDPQGAPRAGVRLELTDGDPDRGPVRRFGVPATTDARGVAHLARPAGRGGARLFVVPELLLLESHAAAAPSGRDEDMTLPIPDLGAVDVTFVDAAGDPYLGSAEALLLPAENDPPLDGLVRARATAKAEHGVARFSGVETGLLLLLEGRTADPALRVVPLRTEGPSVEGARLRTTLRVVPRGAASSAVRAAAPHLGPPKARPADPGPGEGAVDLRPEPADALPAWPNVLEVAFAPVAGGEPDASARVDEKRVVRANLPAGRRKPRLRLWRATPDGWFGVDVGGAAPAPIEARVGETRDLPLPLDAAALAAAAALLADY